MCAFCSRFVAVAIEGRDPIELLAVSTRIGRNCGHMKGTLSQLEPVTLAQVSSQYFPRPILRKSSRRVVPSCGSVACDYSIKDMGSTEHQKKWTLKSCTASRLDGLQRLQWRSLLSSHCLCSAGAAADQPGVRCRWAAVGGGRPAAWRGQRPAVPGRGAARDGCVRLRGAQFVLYYIALGALHIFLS